MQLRTVQKKPRFRGADQIGRCRPIWQECNGGGPSGTVAISPAIKCDGVDAFGRASFRVSQWRRQSRENGRFAHGVALLQIAQAHADHTARLQARMTETTQRIAAVSLS
ncbi:hypothetical protein [Rhodanobacter lindaniclasticus]